MERRGAGVGGVLHDLKEAAPDPHDYTTFYVVDLPPFSHGVPVFQNGWQEAVQETYDNTTLAAHATSCSDLQKGDLPSYSLFFRYKPNRAQTLPSRGACLGRTTDDGRHGGQWAVGSGQWAV